MSVDRTLRSGIVGRGVVGRSIVERIELVDLIDFRGA